MNGRSNTDHRMACASAPIMRLAVLVAIVCFLAVPLASRAQQPSKVYRLGHVSLMSPSGMAPYVAALEQRLQDLGYVKGRNIIIEHRSANGNPELVAAAAAELVALNVDVIITGTNLGVVAAQQQTRTIPIVMVYGMDPVGAGFVASLARPGGNVTGGTFEATPDIYAKKVELLKEAVPRLARVAFLWNSTFPGATTFMKAAQEAARRLRLEFQAVDVRGQRDLDGALASIVRTRADGIIVLNDPVLFPLRARVGEFAARQRLPVVAPWSEFPETGALLSYGFNSLERWRRAAIYVDKLLKGAKPADLPVEQPTTFELVINLKVAKELGINVPPSLMLRADRIIE